MFDPEAVLTFWLGPLDESGRAAPAQRARWFTKDPAFDTEIRERFGAVHEAVVRGDCDEWLMTPRGRLAFIIVLDQLSRNIYRGDARAFGWDDQALAVALDGIDSGDDRAVPAGARAFFYLPLMHAEDLEMQERAVELYERAGDAEGLAYAKAHRAIIRRFGRFPHRNEVLGRASTKTELEFLKEPGSSF